MNEKLLTFLHHSTIAIILICIALFIAYLIPSKEPYNINKVSEINKDLQQFSKYSTSLTTPKEVNTLDTTDSIDEYCGSLNKDACNNADEMCTYDGSVCKSRKYNYNIKQTQIIGSVNTFHNSKYGDKETLQYKDIIQGIINQGIRTHCISITTDVSNTENNNKLYIIRTTKENSPVNKETSYYSNGNNILLSDGLKMLLKMSTDSNLCKNSTDPIIIYLNIINPNISDASKKELYSVIMNSVPDFKMKPTKKNEDAIVTPSDILDTELSSLEQKLVVFSNVNFKIPEHTLNSYLPIIHIDNDKFNGIKQMSHTDSAALHDNKDNAYVVVFPDDNTDEGELIFVKKQPGIYFSEINHNYLMYGDDILKLNDFDNESISIMIPETLNIKYKQNKINNTSIPVTNTSGVKLPVETTSSTPHTHDKEITVMPVSN
jgi:hypothetical protein